MASLGQMSDYEIRLVRIFKTVVECGGFTAAETTLGISRSAVAGHIMKLMQKGQILGKGYILAGSPYVVALGGANMDIRGSTTATLRQCDSNPGKVSYATSGKGAQSQLEVEFINQ